MHKHVTEVFRWISWHERWIYINECYYNYRLVCIWWVTTRYVMTRTGYFLMRCW